MKSLENRTVYEFEVANELKKAHKKTYFNIQTRFYRQKTTDNVVDLTLSSDFKLYIAKNMEINQNVL